MRSPKHHGAAALVCFHLGFLCALLAACQGSTKSSSADRERVAVTVRPLGVTGGDVPLPVAPCAADLPAGTGGTGGGTGGAAAPVVGGMCDPATRPVVWNGTYAELLAADAMAECYLT